MNEEVTLHSLDKRVGKLEDWRKEYPKTVDLEIRNAVNGVVIKILSGIGLLLAAQSLLEKLL